MIISLLDGTQADTADITFNSADYSFTLNTTGEDLTNLIRVPDKIANWPDFDVTTWNNMVYNQIYAQSHGGQSAPAVGSTSTLINFADLITTDPLGAPLSALNTGIGQIFSSSGVWALVAVGLGGFALWMMAGSRGK